MRHCTIGVSPVIQDVAPAAGVPVRRPWHQNWALLGALVAALAVDQVSKYLVRQGMEPGQVIPAEGLVRLQYVTNTGSALGLFQGQTLFLALASLTGIALLVLFYRSHTYLPRHLRFGLGLLLGGAIGNLADRLIWGGVTDFISVGWWPTFNLADSAIVVGIVILATALLLPPRHLAEVEGIASDRETQERFILEALRGRASDSCAEEPGDALYR